MCCTDLTIDLSRLFGLEQEGIDIESASPRFGSVYR